MQNCSEVEAKETLSKFEKVFNQTRILEEPNYLSFEQEVNQAIEQIEEESSEYMTRDEKLLLTLQALLHQKFFLDYLNHFYNPMVSQPQSQNQVMWQALENINLKELSKSKSLIDIGKVLVNVLKNKQVRDSIKDITKSKYKDYKEYNSEINKEELIKLLNRIELIGISGCIVITAIIMMKYLQSQKQIKEGENKTSMNHNLNAGNDSSKIVKSDYKKIFNESNLKHATQLSIYMANFSMLVGYSAVTIASKYRYRWVRLPLGLLIVQTFQPMLALRQAQIIDQKVELANISKNLQEAEEIKRQMNAKRNLLFLDGLIASVGYGILLSYFIGSRFNIIQSIPIAVMVSGFQLGAMSLIAKVNYNKKHQKLISDMQFYAISHLYSIFFSLYMCSAMMRRIFIYSQPPLLKSIAFTSYFLAIIFANYQFQKAFQPDYDVLLSKFLSTSSNYEKSGVMQLIESINNKTIGLNEKELEDNMKEIQLFYENTFTRYYNKEFQKEEKITQFEFHKFRVYYDNEISLRIFGNPFIQKDEDYQREAFRQIQPCRAIQHLLCTGININK
eukprot:403348661